jgi:hypothetical protein
MRNVTIVLEEEVARWVRVRAAEHVTSASGLVGEMLQGQMERARGYEQAMAAFLSRGPVILKSSGSYPTRDELHERTLLR